MDRKEGRGDGERGGWVIREEGGRQCRWKEKWQRVKKKRVTFKSTY